MPGQADVRNASRDGANWADGDIDWWIIARDLGRIKGASIEGFLIIILTTFT